MKYEELLNDIEQLVGLDLQSIRPGAEIRLLDVKRDEDRIELENASGRKISRPLSEFEKIWTQLVKRPAVHVDTALGGSGSSRNQPETIIANLPYIEWCLINRKKHIVFVGNSTHVPGTLKEVDPFRVETIKELLQQRIEHVEPSLVIVTDSIVTMADNVELITGLPVASISPGVYGQERGTGYMLLVEASATKPTLKSGSYAILEGNWPTEDGVSISIGIFDFWLTYINEIAFLVKKDPSETAW